MTTAAVLLRKTPYGESDLIVETLTEMLGRVSAIARGARRSRKRFAGTLEPMHELRLALEPPVGGGLFGLREASIQRPRRGLVSNLEALAAAARALGWARKYTPSESADPAVWTELCELLDRLDVAPTQLECTHALAAAGVRLLEAFGWGLELSRCVACGRLCATGRAALLDLERGGLVCRGCGGGKVLLRAPMRAWLTAAASSAGPPCSLPEAALALELVESVLVRHAG